jgi:hypothetical protein
LGIGADRQWDRFFDAYLAKVKDPLQTDASRDIVWRARTDKAVPYIAQLAAQQQVAINNSLGISGLLILIQVRPSQNIC